MNIKTTIVAISSLMVLTLVFSFEARATIYKCVNDKSEVYYNDRPCPVNDKESQLAPVKDPVNGYVPTLYSRGLGGSQTSKLKKGDIVNKENINSEDNDSSDSVIKTTKGSVQDKSANNGSNSNSSGDKSLPSTATNGKQPSHNSNDYYRIVDESTMKITNEPFSNSDSADFLPE